MFNPNHQHNVEMHMRALRHEADQRRLAQLATNAAHPAKPIIRRLMTAAGQQMVESGHFLLSKGEDGRAEAADWEYIGRVLS